MYGVVTRNAEELEWDAFENGFYEIKDVTGRSEPPVATGVNMLSCFGDNATGEADPDVIAVDDAGNRATREQPYFDWTYVCPSRTDYWSGLFEILADATEVNPDVRLDDVGFPRGEYCHCEVCDERFAGSDREDRMAWRADLVTEFVERAVDGIPGRTYLTLYPDPYPGHLYARNGLDLERIADLIDEFVVTLYDMAYATTYWLEVIASGFADRLEALPVDWSVELYAVEVDLDRLAKATEVVETYAGDVYFGYDAGNARAVIRRLQAETGEGETYRPEDADPGREG